MIESILEWLNPTRCAEIAMLLFFGVFLAIALRTMLASQKSIEESANLPLSDGEAHRP